MCVTPLPHLGNVAMYVCMYVVTATFFCMQLSFNNMEKCCPLTTPTMPRFLCGLVCRTANFS